MRRRKPTTMNYNKFKKWLQERGCEILPPTNEYEAVRFKGKEVGVLYTPGKVSNQFTRGALRAFRTNSKWNGSPINTGRKSSYRKEKARLIERDGTTCFLCGQEMGDDITLEHLIPLTAGGPNSLSNMVLCHEECNHELGTKPLAEKVRLAVSYRSA